ncbi:biopolymer transporter ExbD [Erythrobacter sp.]|uniref:ExbD/TolR family protein n=1 Tax=Erythrobacter sp. TaxID=1042 RepID=UPI001425D03B|nr:biopolymer transporter ExbD [Erythrobacter sp.]QIQ87658.1 MAG: hypothetical protein G9473_13900 [Erythrobacter sp.]
MPRRPARPAASRSRFDHGEPIAGIDSHPLVFVSLFVAVVFLMPMTQVRTHAIMVDLPWSWPDAPPETLPYLTVEVGADASIRLEGAEVALGELADWIEASGRHIVLLKAEADAPYGTLAQVLARVTEAGIARDSICFDNDELALHRRLQRIAFQPAMTLMEDPEPPEPLERPPHPCNQFQPPPLY